jgi:hypothetical protein
VAYGTGVFIGCARERTLVPLIPRIAWRARVWSKPALREGLQPPAPQQKQTPDQPAAKKATG